MKNILILGAGMISRPLVKYLLNQPNYYVTMASRTVSKAEKSIGSHKRGKAIALNVNDDKKLDNLISKSDVTVSLIPYQYHVEVAKLCIKNKKHLVTTSYVSEEMHDLNNKAKEAGILLLNECGLDPGIDHMSAMRIIHEIEGKGGKITSFKSTTGALPSHEANTNPFGYKFSWSPKGVLLASKNSAKWLENGKEIIIPGEHLFEHYYLQDVPGIGTFENYPNRNSIPYKKIYGLKDAKTVYRGTFRMTGWCETIGKIVSLGWLNDQPIKNFQGKTYGDLTRHLINAGVNDNLQEAAANFLGLETHSAIIKRLDWLGLFSEEQLPEDKNNPLDYLNVITLKRMLLDKNDRDMIVMYHEFIAEYPNKKECVTSTLINYGMPNDDTAISRTVALPAAIAVKMILEQKINITGVEIPVIPEIYNPILDKLEEIGIKFSEKTNAL
jgi:saccharopine dehydrogenase-like NADP-dependent oxidoreductase